MSIYMRYYLDLKQKNTKADKLPSLEELKKDYVKYLLQLAENDVEEVADILNISQTSLLKKKKKE